MRNAFVTGATGFVGRALVAQLLRTGWRVSVLARSPDSARSLGDVEVIQGDLARPRVPAGIDAVFHLAANIDFKASRERMFADNTQGTANLLSATRGARFIYTSTAGVWGLDHEQFDETSERHPTPVAYLQSKQAAEDLVRAARNVDAVILNPGHIVGPGGGWSQMFERIKSGSMPFAPPGIASWCDRDALVDAQLAAVDRAERGASYLLGGDAASYVTFAAAAARRLGVNPPRRAPAWLIRTSALFDRTLPHDLARILCGRLVFSSERAQRVLGYRPRSPDSLVEAALSPSPA